MEQEKRTVIIHNPVCSNGMYKHFGRIKYDHKVFGFLKSTDSSWDSCREASELGLANLPKEILVTGVNEDLVFAIGRKQINKEGEITAAHYYAASENTNSTYHIMIIND